MSQRDDSKRAQAQALERDGVPADRMTRVYERTAPWEIGGPQPEVVRLFETGRLAGRVLDVGCGSGDNAIYLAEQGVDVLGVDLIALAIERARAKVAGRGLPIEFRQHDALRLTDLGEQFATILDSGLLHVFSDAQREQFVRQLREVALPGGMYYMLCFSDEETREKGPRRLTREEITAVFDHGWRVEELRPARYAVTLYPDGARSWFAAIRRL